MLGNGWILSGPRANFARVARESDVWSSIGSKFHDRCNSGARKNPA